VLAELEQSTNYILMLSAQLLRSLKKLTGFKKGADVVLLEMKYGSAAFKTWKQHCPPTLKIKLVPYYGEGPRVVKEKDYGPVSDAVDAVLGPPPILLGRDAAFEAFERIRREAPIPRGTAIVSLAVVYDNCVIGLLLTRA